jgi:asparagine synthase (glutamine-hydrolysing)
MCGIAGYIGRRPLDDRTAARCLALMGRRGPDHAAWRQWQRADGTWVALLHTRLAIIDLDERSSQPFEHDGKWLVYNGELYNYVELRAELERAGAAFRTDSDTEVLLQGIVRDGWGFLDRAEGMWAFALFDPADGTVTLGRDRFGEKPLYLHRGDDAVVFASEVKVVHELMGRTLPVDWNHVARFLVNGYKALYKTPDQFFEGLEAVPAAAWGTVDLGRDPAFDAYWAPAFRPDDAMSREAAVAGVRERMIDTVRLRLRSDVPLAFMLSGGIDSNVLTAIARRVFDYDVHGFSIINTDPRYAETALIMQSVGELGVRHSTLVLEPQNRLAALKELVRYHDAPVFTITYFVQWLLMELVAREGYKISIGGAGADEMLSGYYDHHLFYLAALHGSPCFETSLAAWRQHIGPIVRNPYLSEPMRFVDDPGFRGHIYLDNDRFAGYLRRPFAEPFAEHAYTPALMRNRMMNEMFHESVPVILHEDDLNTMYYSIENRSPYLDRRLFDFCNTIPTRHLVHDGTAKSVLRDAARGIAPDCVLDERRKVGFNAPIRSVLDLGDETVRAELLADGPIFDLVDRAAIAGMFDRNELANSESKFLFNFVTARLFTDMYA